MQGRRLEDYAFQGVTSSHSMYIHPEAWDMFDDNSLSVVQPEKEEIPAEFSAGIAEYILYNIVY